MRCLRMEKGLSQQQLADRLHVERSSVANWEAGRRTPDAAMISQLASALGMDSTALLAAEEPDEAPNIMLVDDEPIILSGGLPVLREALPYANVVGFTRPM